MRVHVGDVSPGSVLGDLLREGPIGWQLEFDDIIAGYSPERFRDAFHSTC